MPTRPADRDLHVEWRPWLRHWDEWGFVGDTAKLRREVAKGQRRTQFRLVLIRDAGSEEVVRFNVAFDPEEREALVQTVTHGPVHSRLPWATLTRIVQRVVDETEPRGEIDFAIRRGKLYPEDATLPHRPARRHEHQPRKAVDLKEVAITYLAHPKAGTRAVSRRFQLSWRTAARRVADARAAGLLPPPP